MLKRFIKLLVPPIIIPGVFKAFRISLNKDRISLIKDKDKIKYEKNFYCRTSFVLKAINAKK